MHEHQARGGCACAGPYAQALMGLNVPPVAVRPDGDTAGGCSPAAGSGHQIGSLAQQYEQLLLEDPRLDRRVLRRDRSGQESNVFSYEVSAGLRIWVASKLMLLQCYTCVCMARSNRVFATLLLCP